MGRGGMRSRQRQHKERWHKIKSDPEKLVEHYRKKNEKRRKNG